MNLSEIEKHLFQLCREHDFDEQEVSLADDWHDAAQRALLHSLSSDGLDTLIERWEHGAGCPATLYYRALGVRKSKQRTMMARISTATLLKYFSDKKSGKIGLASRELRNRFHRESAESQRVILKAFLLSLKIKEIEWASRILRDHWIESMMIPIKYAWVKTQNPLVAQVVLKHLPDAFVFRFQEELAEAAGYVYVCARLARNPEFTLDESRLSTPDYLYALAKSASDHYDPGALEAKIEAYLSEDGWISVREIGLILWSLGKLGLPDTIIRLKPRIEERLQKNEEETPFLNLEEPPF